MMTKNNIRGSVALVVAVCLYGMYGVYSRMIGIDFGAFSQAWIRSLIIVFILGVWLIFNRERWKKIRKKDLKWMVVWPLSGVMVMVFLFIVFNHLPLGIAYLLFYSTMILGGVLSGKFFFKEKLDSIKLLSISLAIVGLILVYSFNISLDQVFYVILALLSGLLLGLWNTLSKKVSGSYGNIQLVLIDSMFPLFLGILGAIVTKESVPELNFSNKSWIWLVIFAITQICSTRLLVYGFKNLEAQIGSIIMPVEVVFATLFGFVFFRETLSLSSFLGGSLIVFAAALPNLVSFSKNTKIVR